MRRRRHVVMLLAAAASAGAPSACSIFTTLDGFSSEDAVADSSGGSEADRESSEASGSDAQGQDGTVTLPPFQDDFSRPNGGDVGNDWTEKRGTAFQIWAGAVERLGDDGSDSVDNLAYRPLQESVLDTEVSVEVSFRKSPPGYPQVHARVQPGSVKTPATLDSYVFFVNNSSSSAVLGRQHGGSSGRVALLTLTLSPTVDTTSRFRLRLRVTGAGPEVTLRGTIEKLVSGQWSVIGQGSIVDSAPDRIVTPGTVGFAGGLEGTSVPYVYDNFTRTTP